MPDTLIFSQADLDSLTDMAEKFRAMLHHPTTYADFNALMEQFDAVEPNYPGAEEPEQPPEPEPEP